MNKLGQALLAFMKPHLKKELKRGTIKSVDKARNLCTVTPFDNGADYIDVKLTASEGDNVESVIMYPKIGSSVYIGLIDGNDSDTFVAQMTEVDEIVFHNGNNGGMTITPELVKQLKIMSNRIDILYKAIEGGVIVPLDGGASLKSSMLAITQVGGQKENFSKIENEKIKH